MYDDSPDDVIKRFAFTAYASGRVQISAIRRSVSRPHVSRSNPRDAGRPASRALRAGDVLIAAGRQPRSRRTRGAFGRSVRSFSGSAVVPQTRSTRLHAAVNVTARRYRASVRDAGHARALRCVTSGGTRFSVLDTILGGGMSSPALQEVREERGSPTMWPRPAGNRAAGLFGVSAGHLAERVQECIDVIVDADRPAGRRWGDEREVASAREHLKGNMTLALESTSSPDVALGPQCHRARAPDFGRRSRRTL